jgi:hypothetical protein
MDFVTICFINDIPQLKIQARSFDKFLQNFPVERIIVVVNGYFEICQSYFEQHIRHCYGSFADRVELISANNLIPKLMLNDSYFNQMRLKVLISREATAEHICLLDAKNFLVNEWTIEDVYRDGKLRCTIDEFGAHPNWKEHAKRSFEIFGLDESKYPVFSPHTPFFVERSLLDFICNKPNLLEEWQSKHLVEFLLITAAVFDRDKTIEKSYWTDKAIWTKSVWPEELGIYHVKNCDQIIEYIFQDTYKLLSAGLHRKCVVLAAPHILNAFAMLWERLGLMTREESEDFIDQMRRNNRSFQGRSLQ